MSLIILHDQQLPRNFSDDFLGGNKRWLGSTWANVGGKAVNTPTLGAELVTNGNMEAGDPPTGWTAQGSAVISSVGEERTGGTGTKSINIARGSNNDGAYQSKSTTLVPVNSWFVLSGWTKNISCTNVGFEFYSNASDGSIYESASSWTFKKVSSVRSGTAGGIYLKINGSAGQEGRLDDVSLKLPTFSTLFRLFRSSTPYGTVKAAWTIVSGTPAGVAMNVDDPYNVQNCVYANHNGTNAILRQRIAGVETVLINAAATYGADKNVMIKHLTANTYQLYYGTAGAEAQVGTDQTIAGLNGTYHGLFSTDAQNLCSSFSFVGG